MDYLVDNAVPLSAIALGALVLMGLAVLGTAALRLWGAIKVARRRAGAAAADLMAEADRLQIAAAALPARNEELGAAIQDLAVRARVLGVLTGALGEAVAVLRAPLTYIGR